MNIHIRSQTLTILMLCLMMVFATASIIYNWNLHSSGVGHTVGIEVWASDGATILENIDWGEVLRGNTYLKYGYIESTSTKAVTLNYWTNPNPPVFDCSILINMQRGTLSGGTWTNTTNWFNMQNQGLAIDEIIKIQINFIVGNTATLGPFTYDIHIDATAP